MMICSLYSAGFWGSSGSVASLSYYRDAACCYASLHKPGLQGLCSLAGDASVDSHAASCVAPASHHHLHFRILLQYMEDAFQLGNLAWANGNAVEAEVDDRECHLYRFFNILFNNFCFSLIHRFFFFLIDILRKNGILM